MWDVGGWLPLFVSPEFLPLAWLAWLVLAGIGAWRGTVAGAFVARRVLLWLIVAQSAVVVVATSWRPGPGVSINDVYVVAAHVLVALFVPALAWLMVLLVRRPLLPEPVAPPIALPRHPPRSRQGLKWWIVAIVVAAPALAVAPFFLPVLVIWGFMFLREVNFMPVSFVLSGAAAGCWLFYAARPFDQVGLVLRWLSPVAAIGALAWLALFRSEAGMTDCALFKHFSRNIEDDRPSSAAMAELRRRPKARYSSLAQAVRATQLGELTYRVQNQRSKSMGYAGCSMPISLESAPYAGQPDIDLLELLLERGEVEAARAWVQDPRIDSDLLPGIRKALANHGLAEPEQQVAGVK